MTEQLWSNSIGGERYARTAAEKKLILNILQILKDYTDSTNQEHRLTQKEIMEHLERDYDNAKSMDRYPILPLSQRTKKIDLQIERAVTLEPLENIDLKDRADLQDFLTIDAYVLEKRG